MKKIIKTFSLAIVAAILAAIVFPMMSLTGNNEPQKAEAYADGYKLRIEIEALSDDEYLTEAELLIDTKKDYGRGDCNYNIYQSEDITDKIKRRGDKYTSDTIDCGKEFPNCIKLGVRHDSNDLYTYYYCEFIIRVYVNDVLVAEESESAAGTIFSLLINYPRELYVYVPDDKLPRQTNGSADQYGVILPPPAVTYETNYRVKVNIRVTNDCDDWNSAYIWVYTKRDNGVGDSYLRYTSADIKTRIDYTDANYTHETLKTGSDFPYSVHIKTDIGSWLQYHYGEADVTVYINDINVASKHISYGDWNRCEDDNAIEIDQSKYPAPKTWNAYYSDTVDPSEEESTLVNLTPVDQYGVAWTQPISVRNESWPGEDLAEKLDDKGFKWKLSSTKTDNHTTNYYFSTNTGSNVYPTSEHKVTVKFVFPLHVYVKVNGETVSTGSGYAGETIDIPDDLETPVGYVIGSFDITGNGTVEKDENGHYKFSFIGDSATLTAKLKPITYTIKYDQNHNEAIDGTMLDKKANYGKTFALATNQFKRQNYKFTGWNTAPDGSGTAYSNKQKVSNLASEAGTVITLYAQWEPSDASVTASLFTDGDLGLLLGGALIEGGVIALVVFLIARARRAKLAR